MVQCRNPPFHLLLRISLQQHRRLPKIHAHHQRIVVLRLRAHRPIARRKQHAHLRSTEVELIALPSPHDFHAERLCSRNHIFQRVARRQQPAPHLPPTPPAAHNPPPPHPAPPPPRPARHECQRQGSRENARQSCHYKSRAL